MIDRHDPIACCLCIAPDIVKNDSDQGLTEVLLIVGARNHKVIGNTSCGVKEDPFASLPLCDGGCVPGTNLGVRANLIDQLESGQDKWVHGGI